MYGEPLRATDCFHFSSFVQSFCIYFCWFDVTRVQTHMHVWNLMVLVPSRNRTVKREPTKPHTNPFGQKPNTMQSSLYLYIYRYWICIIYHTMELSKSFTNTSNTWHRTTTATVVCKLDGWIILLIVRFCPCTSSSNDNNGETRYARLWMRWFFGPPNWMLRLANLNIHLESSVHNSLTLLVFQAKCDWNSALGPYRMTICYDKIAPSRISSTFLHMHLSRVNWLKNNSRARFLGTN